MSTISSQINNGFSPIDLANARKIANEKSDIFTAPSKQNEEKTSLQSTAQSEKIAAEPVQKIPSSHQSTQALTLFNTQIIAQNSDTSDITDTNNDKASYDQVVEKFQDYMELTPEERMFKTFLDKEGLTEEQFNALPIKEKEKLLKKFEAYVEQLNEEAREKQAKRELKDKHSNEL